MFFGRVVDGLPNDLAGLSFTDATHYCIAFKGDIGTLNGVSNITDQDIVCRDDNTWSKWDGSANGLSGGVEIDALDIAGNGDIYFSTEGNDSVTAGIGGSADDADIYRWSAATGDFSRVVDMSTLGFSGQADVNALSYTSATDFCVSFVFDNTTVPGIGDVQDEEVLCYSNGSWSRTFTGGDYGLNESSGDIDALDITSGGTPPPPAAGALGFASGSYTEAEAGLSVTLVVNRTGGSAGAVSVNYAASGGSATPGADYTVASGQLNFANGVTSQTIVIGLINDTAVENDETFNVTLSNPTNGASIASGLGNSVVTITSEDVTTPPPAAGALGFAVDYTAAEASLAVTLVVSRTGGSAGTVAVDYATIPGTATAGADFTAASGSLSFGNGVVSQTIVIGLINDTDVESNEAFSVSLSNPTNGASIASGQGSSQVTVTSEDVTTPPPGNGSTLYFSTSSSDPIPGVPSPHNDADVYNVDLTSGVFGRDVTGLPNDVSGLDFTDATHYCVGFKGSFNSLNGVTDITDQDIICRDGNTWSKLFDGSSEGFSSGVEIDAFDIAANGDIYFSTEGNDAVPGIGGSADDADIYRWNAATGAFTRAVDATALGFSGQADINALSYTSATDFCVSFVFDNTTVPGLGNVDDEDVLCYANSVWTVKHDGTSSGSGDDIDALDL